MLDIATPKPLAYIEQLKEKLIWKSYLVSEYVEGKKLYDFRQINNTTKEQHQTINNQIKEMFDEMEKNHITHGDLKHTNILITDKGPVLTDLDGMKVHKWAGDIRVVEQRTCSDSQNKDKSALLSDVSQRIFYKYTKAYY